MANGEFHDVTEKSLIDDSANCNIYTFDIIVIQDAKQDSVQCFCVFRCFNIIPFIRLQNV